MTSKIGVLIATSVGLLLLSGCGPAPAAQVSRAGEVKAVAHPAGTQHPLQPKRLETVVEIDMGDLYFATPDGTRAPVFRLPAGKTVGLHLHNEGGVVHELLIGRKPLEFTETEVGGQKVNVPEGYQTSLFKELEADVFFYYGDAKAEVGGATFEELEIEPGIKDTWIRFKVPDEMKGEWELGCFVAGHYEAGMHATLIVE